MNLVPKAVAADAKMTHGQFYKANRYLDRRGRTARLDDGIAPVAVLNR